MQSVRGLSFRLVGILLATFGAVLSWSATPIDSNMLGRHRTAALALAGQLGPGTSLNLVSSDADALGMTHAHFQQYFRGVRVFGGEVITHIAADGALRRSTEKTFRGINVSVVPKLQRSEAIAVASRLAAPSASAQVTSDAELVVYPLTEVSRVGPGSDATAFKRTTVSYALAYIVSVSIVAPREVSQTKYVVDASTGAVIKTWNDLHTSAAVGSGSSQYSGTVSLNTNSISGGYELRDTTRGSSSGTFGTGNVVTNMANGTSGNGTIYTDSDNAWGDGTNYSGSGSTSANGQTAAVDAAYGAQVAWDMYGNVLARNGIDNSGTSTYSRVHYGTGWDNAAWAVSSCFCMTYGDGTTFSVVTALDIAGHELTHGVTEHSVPGGLTYSAESGGLNESSSDIMGTMAEFYANGGGFSGHSGTIPATGGNWTIGEQLTSGPLRYMYKPSLDSHSYDAWNSSIYLDDVHYSSGPGNRAFYFLSQGASSNSGSNYYSSYLPHGMTGIGNDNAAKIHYRALTTYYTSNMDYADARDAYIDAATDLYGASSPQVRAAQNSFAAINVGAPAPPNFNALISVITSFLLN